MNASPEWSIEIQMQEIINFEPQEYLVIYIDIQRNQVDNFFSR